jgi:hypothetical protein
VNGRLHCAIGLSDPIIIKTNFSGPFKWQPGNTEDFDAEDEVEEEIAAKDGIPEVVISLA